MGLAVFGVLGSELEEVPLLRALVQVVADAVELVLGPAAGHDAQRRAELRSQPGLTAARSAAATTSTAWFLPGWNKVIAVAAPVSARSPRSQESSMSPRRSVSGQPSGGGGHGGVSHRACAVGAWTGASCRSTRSCSPDQVPVTVAQPSTRPSFSKRPTTASKSAPATRTAPLHTGLTWSSRPPGAAIGRAGSNQSPRSFRISRPVAATRSPSRTTRPSTSTWPG